MTTRILENLTRQKKAIEILHSLLEEEFAHLRGGSPKEVSSLEVTIHELIRQIAVERDSLVKCVREAGAASGRLKELLPSLPEEAQVLANHLLAEIDAAEQRSARQSAKNQHLASALLKQSRELVDFIQDKVAPRAANYGSNGRFNRTRGQAAVLSGRL